MIRTEDLSKKFDDFLAVDKVSIEVKAGEVMALLGPNGAGKTTTVRMLTSVLIPTQGDAWVAGFNVRTEAVKVRGSVGVLTENHGLYNRMPALEYLDFFGQIYDIDKPARTARGEELLQGFGLWGDRDRRIGEFSKGMRQKLALARSMLHKPPVLLLDEPTSAMDPESARLVRQSIIDMRSDDRAVIICTHNLVEAEQLADHIGIIRAGKIVAYGSPQALKQEYLGLTEYQVRLADPLNGQMVNLPPGLEMTGSGEDWLRFGSPSPRDDNPRVLQILAEQGLAVVSLQEVDRSLEQVYLNVMKAHGEMGKITGTGDIKDSEHV